MANRIPVRAIWMVVGAIAVVVFTVMGTLHVVSALAHEEATVTNQFAVDGLTTIEVHADSGSVRIVGVDTDEVVVTENVSDGLRATGHRIVREGSSLVAESTCPNFLSYFCRVDYTIRVPVAFDVVVRAGGGVNVSDVRGDVDVATSHGDLSIARIEGDAILAADHGSVSVSFASPPDRVDAESDHGDVDVVLPRGDELYQVDASTDHGSSDVAVRTAPDAARVVRARSDHGDVTVRYPGG
jgi:Putative adhesin